MESKLPGIESTAETYVEAWEIFGNEQFSIDELWNELMGRSSDVDNVPQESTLDSRLYRAAAYGIADWYGDGEYQLQLAPEDSEEEWEQRAVNQMNQIREEIKTMSESKSTNGDDDINTRTLEGDTYIRSDVSPDSDIEKQARYYQAVLKAGEHSGVVLRAFPSVADGVLKLAKEICDDETMEEAGCPYRFEIVDEEIQPTDDDQEYLVYLRETRFLN